jgi:hypothetical protein
MRVLECQETGSGGGVKQNVPFLRRLKCSIKGEVKENTSPLAGIFPASPPVGMSKICFDRPHHLLGWFGFPLLAIFIAVGNEAVCSETSKAERRSNGDHSSI